VVDLVALVLRLDSMILKVFKCPEKLWMPPLWKCSRSGWMEL